MPSVCFYFQVHQPFRIRPYTFFDIGHNHHYFDDDKNKTVLDKVSEKCYLPTNKLMLELIEKHQGKFKIAYSISGVALEQFETWRPDVLESFKALAKTGCVEFISETYYHSLAYIFNKDEFIKQIDKHKAALKKHFNYTPKIFRNTELQYNNELAKFIEDLGYKGILCEGVDNLLNGRSPNFIYQAPNVSTIKSLLKNYQLSDDIAFRFSNQGWAEFPLTAEKFSTWAHSVAGNGETINLFMDYETFGEHQWADTRIFDFMRHLPDAILKHPDFSFKTPTETVESYSVKGIYDCHNMTSWADMERDLSAWIGNPIQDESIYKVYALKDEVYNSGNKTLIESWEKLLTSDHFYYMTTKFWSDGDVHKYFSPYDSPYDAYIYYMNVLSDFVNELNKIAPPVAADKVVIVTKSVVKKKTPPSKKPLEKAAPKKKGVSKKKATAVKPKKTAKKVVAKKAAKKKALPGKKAVVKKTGKSKKK